MAICKKCNRVVLEETMYGDFSVDFFCSTPLCIKALKKERKVVTLIENELVV